MSKILYILYSGYGIDGGFGDYAGVRWNRSPVQVAGKTVWFDNPEIAEQTVKELNERSANKFYSTGFHSSYDGNFPMEYKVQKIEIPENKPFSLEATDIVSAKDSNNWISEEYEYDNEDYLEYDDFLTKNNLPMSSETYELWLKEFEND